MFKVRIFFLGAVPILIAVASATPIALEWFSTEIQIGLDRYQTLFGGLLAGSGAISAALLLYETSRMPIDAENQREARKETLQRAATSANLILACDQIKREVSKCLDQPQGKIPNSLVAEFFRDAENVKFQSVEVINYVIKINNEFNAINYLANQAINEKSLGAENKINIIINKTYTIYINIMNVEIICINDISTRDGNHVSAETQYMIEGLRAQQKQLNDARSKHASSRF